MGMTLEPFGDGRTGGLLVEAGLTIAELRPTDVVQALAPVAPVVAGFVREVAQHIDLAALAPAGGALMVEFPAMLQKGIANGSLALVQTAVGTTMPLVRNVSTGQFAGWAQVVSGGASAGTGTKAAVGTAGATGAAAAGLVLWPILLVGTVGIAAAMAERKWLEASFQRLEKGLGRIEARMRDDDLGALQMADALVVLSAEDATQGDLSEQLRLELAVARVQVESIYRSRRRFVDRLLDQVEAAQNRHTERTGDSKGWVDDVEELLGDESGVAAAELVVYLQAMVVRARLASVTAAVLGADGAGVSAVRLLDGLRDEVRQDYWRLQRPITALSRQVPDANRFESALRIGASERDRAMALATTLDEQMQETVGTTLPDGDERTVIEIPSETVLRLVS